MLTDRGTENVYVMKTADSGVSFCLFRSRGTEVFLELAGVARFAIKSDYISPTACLLRVQVFHTQPACR